MKTTDAETYQPKFSPDDLCRAFFNCSAQQLKNGITADNELEDKTTLAFFVDGQEITDAEFIARHNVKNPSRPISFVGQLMIDALLDEGICSFGTGQDEPFTKTLVSYCYDDVEGTLSADNVTLRVRHEERINPSTGEIEIMAPDVSTKFPINVGSTASRAEFEAMTPFVKDQKTGTIKFNLTLMHIIESQVAKRAAEHGPKAAMNWLEMFTSRVGFDFSNKYEKSNINCKRTVPYAVMYTRYDHEGDLIIDPTTQRPQLFKTNEISAEDRLQGITPANKIVFMFCLDVNRVFAPGISDKKICRDNEWEHEHADHECPYTPGSIASSKGITREEVDAMDAYLIELKSRVLKENDISLSPLSGRNKDDRAHYYIQQALEDGTIRPNQPTVRGQENNFILDRVHGMDDLIKRSKIVRNVAHAANQLRAADALSHKIA